MVSKDWMRKNDTDEAAEKCFNVYCRGWTQEDVQTGDGHVRMRDRDEYEGQE